MVKLPNQELTKIYNDQIQWIRYHARNQYRSLDWCIGALKINLNWLIYLSQSDRIFGYIIVPLQDLSIETRREYKHPVMGDVIKILYYRGKFIPIYNDDYGQQEVAIIDGQEHGAGAYNFFSDGEFMDIVDYNEYYALEKEISGYYKKDEEESVQAWTE